MDLDFSALNSIKDRRSIFRSIKVYILLAIIILIIITRGEFALYLGILIAFFSIIAATWGLFYEPHQSYETYKKFARANNFRIYKSLSEKFWPPLLDEGKDSLEHSVALSIRGELEGTNFMFFPYTFRSDVGSVHAEFGSRWIIYFELPRPIASFVIDAKYNETPIPKLFTDYKALHLEGDFSDYFKLYVPKGDHIDVLSVITPDIMMALYEFWQTTDLIVADKRVWLIGNSKVTDHEGIPHLFDAAQAIIPELVHRARSYQSAS